MPPFPPYVTNYAAIIQMFVTPFTLLTWIILHHDDLTCKLSAAPIPTFYRKFNFRKLNTKVAWNKVWDFVKILQLKKKTQFALICYIRPKTNPTVPVSYCEKIFF